MRPVILQNNQVYKTDKGNDQRRYKTNAVFNPTRPETSPIQSGDQEDFQGCRN